MNLQAQTKEDESSHEARESRHEEIPEEVHEVAKAVARNLLRPVRPLPKKEAR